MKNLFIMALLSFSLNAFAEENNFGKILDEVIVPLSLPDKIGTLEVKQIFGSLTVSGYSGKEVIVTIRQKEKKYKVEKKNGLTRIINNSFNLNIEESDNIIEIMSHPYGKNGTGQAINLEIKVPHKFNLKLSSMNSDKTIVSNISGEIEVTNINGDIILNSIAGSAIVDSVNGSVTASFKSIASDSHLAFSSLNKDIDISLPSNTKANIKAKTNNGEIFTGFELKLDISSSGIDKKISANKREISFEKWVKGSINGGGSELTFSSLNGDIIIRKQD